MQCPQCNAPLEEGAVFCGNCGRQTAPVQALGATVSVMDTQPDNSDRVPVATSRYGPQGTLPDTAPKPAPAPPAQDGTGRTPTLRPQLGNTGRIVLIAVLVLLVVAGGTIGIVSLLRNNAAATGATGLVRFVDSQNSQGHTDTLQITINGLSAPASGSEYDAWLVNEQNEQIFPLGTLVAAGQSFSLNHTDGHGTNLLGLANKLEITLEQGNVSAPTGKVVLIGTFPPLAFIHIRHLLFSFPITPHKIGLLVGLQVQAQLLNSQAAVLQSVVASHNGFGIQCVAQSIIDIIEGSHGSHYSPLSGSCAAQNINLTGDGFGLLGNNGYLALAAAHASLAATQPDATDNIRLHAGHVQIAITNIKGWVTTVDQDAINLLQNSGNTGKIQEIVTLADHAYHGVDINGDEQVDPVPGEAGAITAYIHGQLMATLPLLAGS